MACSWRVMILRQSHDISSWEFRWHFHGAWNILKCGKPNHNLPLGDCPKKLFFSWFRDILGMLYYWIYRNYHNLVALNHIDMPSNSNSYLKIEFGDYTSKLNPVINPFNLISHYIPMISPLDPMLSPVISLPRIYRQRGPTIARAAGVRSGGWWLEISV